ncbi:extracellular solute-binding protein [Paenibacillus sp. OAS669]|uniref:extracellular solute-binding protein n=1 Tax=Paenibacillus sp. OAS669 TaxID=2663821 RepID=UPI0019F1B5E8|nr:extracellular solute-binding protein [Paenibacillus sp. OAS669]MBE1444984.1 multiple sugar transport system substrate-binding protein [Paenibacillus sp. OAS669]
MKRRRNSQSIDRMRAALLLSGLLIALSGCSGGAGQHASGKGDTTKDQEAAKSSADAAQAKDEKVTIEYWQYQYPAKVDLIHALIEDFQKKHPNIIVKQTNFPYDQYNEKVAALVPAGKGPDVINLYYGWLPKYVSSGYLQPLPDSAFSEAAIKQEFFPFVDTAKLNGKYYAIPTAVRTLALFYNKELFTKAGLDPAKPPATWDELVDYAKKLTQKDKNGQYVVEGLAWQPNAQLHHWYRDALVYQAGGKDISDDRRKILWNQSPAGLEAFKYLIDLSLVHKVGTNNFYNDDITAFKGGHAAMNIDGSFQLGGLKKDVPDLPYAIAPLPAYKEKATQVSFWANAITKNVQGKKLEAAAEWLKYLTSKEVQEQWVEKVGELPAKKEVALQEKYAKDEKLGPFIQQLGVAHAHFFVDEKLERDYFTEAVDQVVLNKVPYEKAFEELVSKTQKLYDDYWAKQDKK